jgi:MFS family permease
LRITQGLFMSCAFALTLAYLGERCSASDAGAAFAAYITGNVASNLIGRLLSAVVADHLGLATNFHVFAALNLAGAVLVYFTIQRATPMPQGPSAAASALGVWASHLRNPPLRASFAIGFLILFAFIGTFTYVNFVLVREPYSVGPMQLGFVYLVFLPSILTTPLAGALVDRVGTRPTLWTALTTAALGLPLLLQFDIATVLAGLALVAVGTFLAQATATGFVGKATASDRGAAAGIYLACYFFGGLIGSAVLGSCSTGSVGRPASMASPRRSHWPVFSRRASRRPSDRLRHHLMKNDALHGIGTFLPRCLHERLPGVLVAGPPAHGDAGGSEIDILGVALVLKARSEEANEMHLCCASIAGESPHRRRVTDLLRHSRDEFRDHMAQPVHLALAGDMRGHAARILDVLLAVIYVPDSRWRRPHRVPHMHREDQRVAAGNILENGLGRRVG